MIEACASAGKRSPDRRNFLERIFSRRGRGPDQTREARGPGDERASDGSVTSDASASSSSSSTSSEIFDPGRIEESDKVLFDQALRALQITQAGAALAGWAFFAPILLGLVGLFVLLDRAIDQLVMMIAAVYFGARLCFFPNFYSNFLSILGKL